MVGSVSSSTGAMDSLIGKLTTLMGEEYTKLKGIQDKVASLGHEFRSMKALLEKLACIDQLDAQAIEWRNQVREMTYDIDDFMHQLSKNDATSGFLKKIAKLLVKLWERHKIANKIQEIETNVNEVSERCMRDELVSLVMSEGQGLKMASIVGFGGLGKTTLANVVCCQLEGQFEVHDLMLDLIRVKCEEENFINVIDDSQATMCQQKKIRRVNLQYSDMGYGLRQIAINCSLSQVPSVGFFTRVSMPSFLGFKSSLFPSHLQRLHLEGCLFPRILEWITELHNLYSLKLTVREVLSKADDIGILAGLEFQCLKTLPAFEVGAKPRLQRLDLWLNVVGWKHEVHQWFIPVGIRNLPSSIREIHMVNTEHDGADKCEMAAAESALRSMLDMHHLGVDLQFFDGRVLAL
ncbi:hypothetical protein PR202_gb00296 [Eleusine coracana subsp. coracana]|uniref:Disease resistance N-terminal domain-containing protein n=1 Tax=Eleusine coracana subsp. coracana TaxID=191504 RepID=A0AAV5DTB1_ELECO|nr:hypothetical protein PR202_gb00296 [Eleusine coracana subsp. coracana]